MKNTILLLLLAISLFISSCEHSDVVEYTSDGYLPGYAILLATSSHETGIMKIEAQDHVLRGLIYRYTSDFNFNTYEDLYFKIKEENGVQIAYDIKPKVDADQILPLTSIQRIASKMHMNLHNAVYVGFEPDRKMNVQQSKEANFHKRGHLYQMMEYNNKRGDENNEESEETIEINGKTYNKYTLCDSEEADGKCDFIYMTAEDFEKYQSIQSTNGVYFQLAPYLKNENETINYVIGLSNSHVHFGDKKQFKDIK